MPTDSENITLTESTDALTLRLLKKFTSGSAYYLPEEMIITVDAMRTHARTKNIIFNCFVLSAAEANFIELVNFLKELEKDKCNYPNNTRMQYLLRYSAYDLEETFHWTTADIQVSNGKLTFYLVDPANLLDGLLLQILLIESICSNTEVYSTDLRIQTDSENCGTFALDLAIGLAKILDLYELLNSLYEAVLQKEHNITSTVSYNQTVLNILNKQDYDEHGELESFCDLLSKEQMHHLKSALLKLKHIPRDLLLNQEKFGSLFKNNQDKKLPTSKVRCRSNKRSLDEYIKDHQGEYITNGRVKFGNTAVIKKSKKLNTRSLEYVRLNSHNHVKTLIAAPQIHPPFFKKKLLKKVGTDEAKINCNFLKEQLTLINKNNVI